MTDRDKKKEGRDKAIEQEVRRGFRFSMARAILRAGGGGLMKGGAPLPPYGEAHDAVMVFLDKHLSDAAMEMAIDRWMRRHRGRLEDNLENPVQGLLEVVEDLLSREAAFTEFVRTVDFHQGQIECEKPHFQRPGQPPHPNDEYTFASVRKRLLALAEACRDASK